MNHVVISGNIVADLDKKTDKVAKTRLAHNRSYRKGEEWVQETSFIELAVFGNNIARFEKHLVKGKPVVVTGRLVENVWQNKEGQKRSRIEIVVTEVTPIERPEKVETKSGKTTSNKTTKKVKKDEEEVF